jgi:hypothetical protein
MIEETLFTRLSTFAGLAALVSTRIYPVIMPQGVTHPAVTYQKISAVRETAMGTDPGLVRTRFAINAWDTTYASVKAVINQVRLAMERWRATGIQDCFIETEIDLYDDAARIHYTAMDVILIHTEAMA